MSPGHPLRVRHQQDPVTIVDRTPHPALRLQRKEVS
jgi:hypothetical protein